jgi:hypothetical protein
MSDFNDLLDKLRSRSPSKTPKFVSYSGNQPLSSDDIAQLAEALRGKSNVSGLRVQGEFIPGYLACVLSVLLARTTRRSCDGTRLPVQSNEMDSCPSQGVPWTTNKLARLPKR